MIVENMRSTKYKNVKMIDSELFTIYHFEDDEHVRATIFIDRMKIEKMDLESAVIDIKLKVAKG